MRIWCSMLGRLGSRGWEKEAEKMEDSIDKKEKRDTN